MLHRVIGGLAVLAGIGACSGTAYYVLCLWSARRFLIARRALRTNQAHADWNREELAAQLPPVSILKPLKGTDPEIYESFRSHCLLDYPEYEIIFGVSDPADPAVVWAERLKQEFPRLRITLLICPDILGTNIKVSNLAQMAKHAQYHYLLVNDSDIRVEPDYLRRVMADLLDPEVGMVTCLYRGAAPPTLASRIESLGISTDFAAGVLVAQELEGGIRFGLGSTLAFRKQDLESIGGFEALLDYLADDYELGARIASSGRSVCLSDVVVETFLPAYDLRRLIDHQLRWARSVRDSRKWGYLGLGFTFGIPWALLALLLTQGALWAWVMLGITLVLRLWVAVVVGWSVLADKHVLPWLWLVPARDIFALFLWVASFAGHKIHWRGDYFLLKNGKLARIEP
jgi:ceramide glucosyltransferase